ncbi:MAG: hypothetical protein RBU30_12800 [Polyangia bacterium]|jgi:hypothetical protein|nr:hypothetical protein [Polyangia bacterium]
MQNSGWLKALRAGGLGFKMDEVMSGWHEYEPGFGPPGQLPFEFRVTWGPRRLGPWLNPSSGEFLKQDLAGTVSAGGLTEGAPCNGTLELRYFTDHRLRYDFGFEAGGRPYQFVGEKVNIQLWNLPVSHTTCFGVLKETETGRLVSRSVTHFHLHTAPRFLRTFRLTREPT